MDQDDQPDAIAPNRVSHALVSASFWVSATEIAGQVITAFTTILAARLIAPHQFGIMGVATLMTATLGAFTVSGFEDALVQREEKVEHLLNAVWSWNVLRGLGFFALMAIAAPLLARLYDEPTLLPLTIVCGLAPLITGFHNVGVVLFQRKLNFRKLFGIQVAHLLIKVMVYAPAIYFLRNVWALAIGTVASAVISLAVSYVAHPYRPRFEISRAKLNELFGFGKWITMMSAMIFVITQGDDFFVSNWFGLKELAFYQMAYEISNTPATKITHVLSRATFPTLSRLKPGSEESKQGALNVLRATLLLSTPLSVFLFLGTDRYVAHIVGPRWAPVIDMVKILVIAGYIRSAQAVGGAFFNAMGRPDLNFRMQVPRFFVIAVGILPLSYYYGMRGTCVAVVLSIASTLPSWFSGMRKLADATLWGLFRQNALALTTAAVLAASMLAYRPLFDPSILGAALWLLSSLTTWTAAMWLIGRVTPLDLFAEIGHLRAIIRGSDGPGL